MTIKPFLAHLERLGNGAELLAIIGILLMTFYLQIFLHEMPCPLCLMQRLGYLSVAFCLLLNMRFGSKPLHYGLAILSILFTAAVSLRQIALHIVPGSGAYGDAIFGYHLYTWAFILIVTILVVTTLLLTISRSSNQESVPSVSRGLTHVLFAAVILLIVANLVGVILECGFVECPDNPVNYEMLNR